VLVDDQLLSHPRVGLAAATVASLTYEPPDPRRGGTTTLLSSARGQSAELLTSTLIYATFSPDNQLQGDSMIRTTLTAAALLVGLGIIAAPTALAESGPYKNCTAAHNDGRYNIPKGDSDYKASQDRDDDGVACEG
jgi:hypothetical protein